MGIPDSSLLDLIEKDSSWLSWEASDLTSLSGEFSMADTCCIKCCACGVNLTEACPRYQCQDCGLVFCENCARSYGSLVVVPLSESAFNIKSCKFCSKFGVRHEGGIKYCDKIYPSESLRQSPEPPSPSFKCEKLYGYAPHDVNGSSVTSFANHPSPVSTCCCPSRSDEDEGEDSSNNFLSPSSRYGFDNSDIDLSSISIRHEFYSFKSLASSPSDSPSRIHITSNRVGQSVQLEQGQTPGHQNGPCVQQSGAILKGPETGIEDPDNADDLSIFRDQCEKLQKPLDFENNDLIWFPPPCDDTDDDAENNFFSYIDEDDEVGEGGGVFSSSGSLTNMFPAKEKLNEDRKEPLRAVVQGHFRALVSQLLHGEGIEAGKENSTEDWLDIVTSLSWQAANFVKPDTSGGGSMDPGDYVRVKCIASGSPCESSLIKGVVCTKNIKHKRMTSQYKNPRLLILEGALEYQRVPNQLASFDRLLQQEIDHLKMVVSKIVSYRPNVLLVEKSVSSYAQEYLLAKEISLVLNVRRPLLERIARCTGALIIPSIDGISTTRLGHCELFRLERITEEHEPANQFNKKLAKTLMFFEGCPRRLGCTVLLKGSCREELKKVKHVVQYAVFAAYHLSLETSFLADEGASLPKVAVKPSIVIPEKRTSDDALLTVPNSVVEASYTPYVKGGPAGYNLDLGVQESSSVHFNCDHISCPTPMEFGVENVLSSEHDDNLAPNVNVDDYGSPALLCEIRNHYQEELLETKGDERQPGEHSEPLLLARGNEAGEYYSATDNNQNILVSFSSRCVLHGTVCERSRLTRIKFYGCFDKPLGRYLRDDLFDQTSFCRQCKEAVEAHVISYTHQQGNLTINVRQLPSVKLPGEHDGKIWMWHRCLKCPQIDGVPPATCRVVMSDAAWGLSFGKFLELSFSNHAMANRIASCGHSLQKDCLRYYGFGSMVAFFRYSPIDILSVRLPPAVLEFNGHVHQEWIRKEAAELLRKAETLYAEISDVLHGIEQKSKLFCCELPDASEFYDHIMELKDLLMKEKADYIDLLQSGGVQSLGGVTVDILEVNRLRHSLVIGLHIWDHRLNALDSLIKRRNSASNAINSASGVELTDGGSGPILKDGILDNVRGKNGPEFSKLGFLKQAVQFEQEPNILSSEHGVMEDSILTSKHNKGEELQSDGEIPMSNTSDLSDKIDSLWTGTDQPPLKTQLVHSLQEDGLETASLGQLNENDNPPFRRIMSPARVSSFDSALRIQERIRKGLPSSSLHLSTLRSFHASGEHRNMVRDPVSNVQRTYSQTSPCEAQNLNLLLGSSTSSVFSVSLLPEGARLMVPHDVQNNFVFSVYDDEPTSIVAYALSSKDYEDWVAEKPNMPGGWSTNGRNREDSIPSNLSAWHSFRSLDLDYIHYGSYGSEDGLTTIGTLFTDSQSSPHLRISFENESSNAGGKVKFSVTCYFAKQFDDLRKECCPSKVDFVRSLSRCRRWSAQGGKSNVYFAKSLDERFIIKQVTKTELESFEEFAPEYFKYLKDSLSSGSPTCLAKVLGIYQVTVKHLKGGKETKMDLMVMENLFFNRSISRIYDLKGSARSRYNSDTTGTNKILLDMNLLETLRTRPIFLGSKAKRSLERAVWNDTSFLASVDVVDYSLLVGVDDERKELVVGIIDFMRQYTWDKHLETWVKASGILGGPKNASPTIISPKQYKRRFRKAMTAYFLTVPHQWSS